MSSAPVIEKRRVYGHVLSIRVAATAAKLVRFARLRGIARVLRRASRARANTAPSSRRTRSASRACSGPPKDKTRRFGLNAFKAVGTQFAVNTLIARGTIEAGDTLARASEGNHGQCRGAGGGEARCRAVVYMSDTVVPARVAAIESEGATVVRIRGTYDEAVREMAAAAKSAGLDRGVGYIVARLLRDPAAHHVGVHPVAGGRLGRVGVRRRTSRGRTSSSRRPAWAACWALWRVGSPKDGGDPPRIVSVEPRSAACVQASVREALRSGSMDHSRR